MKHIRPLHLLLATLFFAGLFFSSCKTDSTTESNNYKYQDNTVRIRLAAEPDRLSPYLTRSAYSRMVFERMFMYMMDFDQETLELTPFLGTSVPAMETIEEGPYAGGVKMTFEIKEDAVWPNGSPVTAEDAAFSLKAVLTPGMPTVYQPFFQFFKGFEFDPENDRRFTLYAKEKYILLEAVAASLCVYPKYVFDPDGLMDEFTIEALTADNAAETLGENEKIKAFVEQFTSPDFTTSPEKMVGSGAYELTTWETGQYLILVKKENWWGNKYASETSLFEAYPDTLLFRIMPDQTAALTALKDQELDVANNLDSKDFVELQNNELVSSNYNLETPASPTIYLAYLNNKDPMLADKQVRRAMAHLVDVQDFIVSLYDGLAERVVGPVLKSKPYYNSDLELLEYNLDKAKSLLAEAGWQDGDSDGVLEKEINGENMPLKLELLISNGSKASENLALFMQEGFKRAGVQLDITKKEFRELMSENVRKKDYQIYIGAMGMDLNLDDFHQQWHTESDNPRGGNYTGFGTVEMDKLIDSIRVNLDESSRTEMYKRFQKELYKETPAIFLFSPQERIAIHKRFKASTSGKRPGFFPNSFELKK
jgi:peptide/nickel transport system substrate-binding protein